MRYKDKLAGIKIYGFCEGFFGRDDYDTKTIIASGDNWIVCKAEGSKYPRFASFEEGWQYDQMEQLIQKWSQESEDY
jgi:hypothetical protein